MSVQTTHSAAQLAAPLSSIVMIGGGPAGLYAALLLKKRWPTAQVTVVERNKPYDTFGWGVVLSDQTLDNLRVADAPSAQLIGDAFNHWDDIEVFFKGERVRTTGHGFCGIGRKHLLNILQDRCTELGVDLVFNADVGDETEIAAQYQADLIVACDGLNSKIRSKYAAVFEPDVEMRDCRFVWLGTKKTFDAFTFAFEHTPHGWFAAHAYKFNDDTSTFIVETPQACWAAHGLDAMTQDEATRFCERLFAKYLDGNALMTNAAHLRGSANWIQFPRVVCKRWVTMVESDGRQIPLVLMGDAAHTAHFSIGSGTKLALEDAIELDKRLGEHGDVPSALQSYEALRSVEVLKIQNAARNSTEWFENVERYSAMQAQQFSYSLLTRSQRISHENLRVRDRAWLQGFEAWLADTAQPNRKSQRAVLPMLTPLVARGLTLANRIVVSPMATYSAVDGLPQDFHLVHLGARAMGGAGLVFAEMTCVSAPGRITPGCPGLYTDAQRDAWARIVRFVHDQTPAKIGVQLGHSGPKGSTRVGWEGTDMPLPSGNWDLIAASGLPWSGANAVPAAMTEADMARVTLEFVASTIRAANAGFDWLELHCAHGYLLSSFICPLTNVRTDAYGGSLANRIRFPLAVFAAVRAAWPQDRPMSVRISAHDWAIGGNTADDAVEMARAFKAHGADFIDVSSGQTTPQAKPVYGRMYQTPFADRIRNEAGIRTIAVGAITEADHANSIIAAGRADLCAVARPHLANPAWTLFEAAKLQSKDVVWPRAYEAGRDQLYREFFKQNQPLVSGSIGPDATE